MFLLISSNFQSSTFEIITITVTEIVLIQMLFSTIGSKQKNKIENTEYHGTFIQVSSRLRSSIFLLLGSWNLVSWNLIFFLGIVKIFPIILPSNLVDVQRLHEKGKFFYAFLMVFYPFMVVVHLRTQRMWDRFSLQ